MMTILGASRGERFFNALSNGSPIAWGFVALATVGWIIYLVEYYRKKRQANPASISAVSSVNSDEPCRHCGAMLRPNASFCRHCREFLS